MPESETVDQKFTGGCHCGNVRFALLGDISRELTDCNCSICAMTGYLHLFVTRSQFTLLTPWENLSLYTFNSGEAKHWFCSRCGIKSFYLPRSHPDGYSINARCVDHLDLSALTVTPFDGRNWERNIDQLR